MAATLKAVRDCAGPRTAIESGFRSSATVVTAAALIMITVFPGFIGSHDLAIRSIGFGLAVAVACDAFVVRMTRVPAVLALLGDRAWWLPRRLARLIPDVDFEGEKPTSGAGGGGGRSCGRPTRRTSPSASAHALRPSANHVTHTGGGEPRQDGRTVGR